MSQKQASLYKAFDDAWTQTNQHWAQNYDYYEQRAFEVQGWIQNAIVLDAWGACPPFP